VARQGRRVPPRPGGGPHPAILFRNKPAAAVGRTPPTYGTPAETVWGTIGTKSTTVGGTGSGSLTWVTGDIILVLGIGADTGVTLGVPTATGLTFAQQTSSTITSACTGYAWTATAASGGSGAIQVVPGRSNPSDFWGIIAWVVHGSDGIGTKSAGADTAQTISTATTQDNSAVFEAIGDWGTGSVSGHTWTPSGQTEREASQNGTAYTVYAADWADRGTAGTVSYGVSVTASGQNYTKIAIEMLGTTASVGAPAVPFQDPRQAGTLRILPARRGRQTNPVPAQVIVAQSSYIPQLDRARAKLFAARRRAMASTPPVLSDPPGVWQVDLRARLKLPRFGRSRQANPVPAQATVPPPPYVPQTLRARVKALAVRRRQVPAPVLDQAVSPQQGRRGRLKFPRLARGEQATPVPPQVAVTAPTYPPQALRTRLKFLRIWRGRAAAPVPPQIVLTAPTYVPQGLRVRVRSLRLFRGRTAQPVPPQITVAPPAYVANRARQATVRATLARRGHTTTPPVAQARAPLFTRVKLRAVRIFRGKPRPVVPPQVVVVPPAYPPQSVRAKKTLWGIRHRRAPLDGWIVSEAHSCETVRPSTGVTARPTSGTTAYNAATTARPNTGTTARPNTGTTEDPC
jgi:hypothetical protein